MLELQRPELTELKPRITVIGVGGAGGNAVTNMINANLMGVDFVVANTDAQVLALSKAETRIQLGLKITQGLGAGSRPEIGRAAAEETLDQIEAALEGSHMCFITAGMGGGTGTGAAPVVARAARERGILTVGVVTKPFSFEGSKRMRSAEEGIAELQKHVDTLIIIPNQNLFLIANANTTFKEAFAMADQVLHQGVRGITDLMIMPGLINLDFADVRTVMSEMGKAMMGTGEASGERRAIEAAEKAIANPLLDEVSMRGAKGVLINITGGDDLRLMEVDEAANHIRNMVDSDAEIIVGSAFNKDLDGIMRVSVVATGIDAQARVPSIGVPRIADRPRDSIFGGQSSIFNTPAAAAPVYAPPPAPEPVAEAAPITLEPPVPVVAQIAEDDDEIDLAHEDRIDDEAPAASGGFVFTPRDVPVVSAVAPSPMPMKASPPPMELEEEKAPTTLFGRMMNLSRGIKHREPPVTLAPEPEPAPADVEIPPFFKRQVNR